MADSENPRAAPKPKPASKAGTGAKKPAAKKPAPKRPTKPVPTWDEQGLEDAYDPKAAVGNNALRAGIEKDSWLHKWLLEQSNRLFRLLLALSVVLPLAPSIALLVFIVTKRSWGGWLVQWVDEDRGDVQVLVSMIVSTLTYFNVLIISKLLWDLLGFKPGDNFVFKFLLSNIKMDSDADKAVNKLGNMSLGGWWKFFTSKWNARDFFKGLACFALLYAPHIIWTGTLTPNITSTGTAMADAQLIPDYTPEHEDSWSNNAKGASGANKQECQPYKGAAGGYSPCIAAAVTSYVYSDMTMATVFEGYEHSKPDNTSYTYLGRSYGVGSGAGLKFVYPDPDQGIAEGRNYTELGYWTDVNCTRNSSSALHLSKLQSPASSAFASFTLGGRLPNSNQNLSNYSIVADINSTDAVAWATESSNRQFILGIGVAGNRYSNLSNIQCQIKFTSTNFYVYQNYTAYNVSVERGGPQPGFDPTGGLANTAISQLGLISRYQTSPYSSDLGDALIYNMQDYYGVVDLNETQQLSSVADAITVALDDILGYVAASQLVQGASKPVQYKPLVQRVYIGTKKYIIVAMFMTGLLFLMAIGRAIWRTMPGDKHGPRPQPNKDEKRLLHAEPQMV